MPDSTEIEMTDVIMLTKFLSLAAQEVVEILLSPQNTYMISGKRK